MAIDEALLYQRIASELKSIRGKKMLTQAQLAAMVGISRTTIANIETGQQKPPLHVTYAICAALDIEPFRILPPLADVSATKPVDVEIEGQTVVVSPKTFQFLASINEQ